MDVDSLMRRFARDAWVRLHGTPRVTVLAGDAQLVELHRSWAAMSGREVSLYAADDVDHCIRHACAHALATPADTVAVHAKKCALDRWRAGRDDRLSALVAEGVIVVSGRAATSGRKASARLDARSAAEWAMFEALEQTPATAGRFKLNEHLSVRFGGVACEVDLLARAERIAIEVDGYHHFTDVDAYRRDRRKDVLLQEHGLIVIRVLASDVVADPRPAVKLACRALAMRGARP